MLMQNWIGSKAEPFFAGEQLCEADEFSCLFSSNSLVSRKKYLGVYRILDQHSALRGTCGVGVISSYLTIAQC